MPKAIHIRRALVHGLVAFTGMGALAAHAQTDALRMDRRENRQAERIDQGVASGQLTRPEQAHMEMRQERIDRMEGRLKADGKVTGQEAARMERAQDKASRRIARNKHDRQQKP
ncbi:hypothetical protein [Hydrogenophaga sp. 2FB]|uniref:hypothetical protein n=1 Tax=Hydrogenophaga sp. 2FB TaxID=2502187 RepID=UPI0010F6762E|nr:hypothetical protein [Hydrogenophaga sp. 2FB]